MSTCCGGDRPGRQLGLLLIGCAAALSLSAWPVAASGADYVGVDWPQWRGPGHDGVTPESGWVKRWAEGGPPIAWRAEIGLGFSSFAVVGDRIWAMGNRDYQETVWCLDTESGEVIWTHSYPGKLVNRLHEGGPCATPTVHEGRVYTVGKEGQVFCLEADSGEVVWRADLQAAAGLEELPQWGFCGSGVVHGDNVIFQAGPAVALDRASGEVAWRSKGYEPAYTTPTPFTSGGQPRLAVLNIFGLVVLDPRDGRELAAQAWGTKYDSDATTPIVHDDRVFISTGYERGCALLAYGEGGLEPVYIKKRPGDSISNHINSSVLYGGHVYGFDGQTHRSRLAELVCMAFETGRERWRHRGLGAGSLIVAGGSLVILTDAGELVIAEASAEAYREVSRAKVLEGKTWTPPVLSHGRIYARNAQGAMVCVDVRPR